ncbi:MAG: WD40 repeat domain-containing protein [Potamolinea sp.]
MNQNFQNRSFTGQNLTGADFSYSDIRGTDFTNARLIGANFSHSIAGLPPPRKNLLIAISFLELTATGIAFYLVSFVPSIVEQNPSIIKNYLLLPGIITFSFLAVLFIFNSHKKITATLVTVTIWWVGVAVVASTALIAPAITIVVAAGVTWALVGVLVAALPKVRSWAYFLLCITVAVMVVLAFVKNELFFALGCAVYGICALQLAVDAALNLILAVDAILPFVLAWVFGAILAFGSTVVTSGIRLEKSGALFWGVGVAVIIAVVVTVALLAIYIAKLTLADSQKFAFSHPITTLIAAKGFTKFRGANLTQANFTQAIIKNTDFTGATLTKVRLTKGEQITPSVTHNLPRLFKKNPAKARLLLLLILFLAVVTFAFGIRGFYNYFQGKFPSHPLEKINSLSSSTFLQKIIAVDDTTIDSVAISPDGQFLVSDSFNVNEQKVQLWDLKTGRLIRTFPGYSKAAFSNTATPNTQTLIVSSKDKKIQLWNLKTGQLIRTLSTPNNITSITISEQGQILASAEENKIHLWNLKSGKYLRTLSLPNKVNAFIMTPDGETLVSVTGMVQKNIETWDLKTGQLISNLPIHPWSSAIAITPDGQTLASSGDKENGIINLWNLETGELLGNLSSRNSVTSTIAFSSDGQMLAGGGVGNRVQLWNVGTGKLLYSFSAGVKFWQVRSVAFSPKQEILASGGEDGTIKIWQLPKS